MAGPKPSVARFGSFMQNPRFRILFLIVYVLFVRLRARRCDRLGFLWVVCWAIAVFDRSIHAVVRLTPPYDAAANITSAPVLQSELSTVKEEHRSQRSEVEDKLESNQSADEDEAQSNQSAGQELNSAVEEELKTNSQQSPSEGCAQQSAVEHELQPNKLGVENEIQPNQSSVEELQYQQSTTKEENHSTTGEKLQPQWSGTEKDFQSQQLTEEDFQPAVQDEHHPTTNEELHLRQSTAGVCSEIAILQESFHWIMIWNRVQLEKCLMNLMICFKKINHPIQFAHTHSPTGSGSSSPARFEPDSIVSLNEDNNDRHHQFKSLFLLDQGNIYLINQSSLLLEDMIHKQIGKPLNQQIMFDVFEYNSDKLERFWCDCFGSVDLNIGAWACMDVSQFTYESAKRCVMNFKVMSRLVSLMKSELDKVQCVPFHQDLKNYYFTLWARQPRQDLIDAADSISKLEWSASHIYQMLVLYEAINEVLCAIKTDEYERIFQQMRINFERIFDKMECFICAKLNGPPCAMNRVEHPATNFLVNSIVLFAKHDSIVLRICHGDCSSSLDHLLPKVISYWAQELKRHSDSYPEGANYIFLLNNLTLFIQETKNLLQNSECGQIVELLKSKITECTAEYLEKCFGPVRNHVELNSGKKPSLSSLKVFMSEFDSIWKCQQNWAVETNLKYNLRREIKQYIIPAFDTFLNRLQKWPISRFRLYCQYKRQYKRQYKAQLESKVDGFFECQHISHELMPCTFISPLT